MKKTQLINSLNKWDTDTVIIFDSEKGQYREIVSVGRGLGKGIIIKI